MLSTPLKVGTTISMSLASNPAAHNSNCGIVVVLIGATLDLAIIISERYVSLSLTREYTTAPYPFSDASQNPCICIFSFPNVPIQRFMEMRRTFLRSLLKSSQMDLISPLTFFDFLIPICSSKIWDMNKKTSFVLRTRQHKPLDPLKNEYTEKFGLLFMNFI